MAALHFHSSTRLQETSACLHRANPIPERLYCLGQRRVPHRPAAALQVATAPALKVATDRKKQLKAATEKKAAVCTADELHYVDVPGSDWRLALWRYLPSPDAPKRNHPLLLLSGIGTNAIGFDLSPEGSFARYMAGQGYDTWTLELRGVGLSTLKTEANDDSNESQIRNHTKEMPFNFIDNFAHSHQEVGKSLSVATQMRNFSRNLLDVIEWTRGSSLPLISGISSRLKDAKKQLDEMMKHNWDFENYLEEDLPAAMEYINTQSKPKDGKMLAIGHSMGGILLYATLARCCFEGRDSGLASITTLGSSLDYSRSSLKMLLPLVDHALGLDVPAIPSGALSTVINPFGTSLSHALKWLNSQIYAQDTTMQPELFEKMLNMFSSVPSNLLLQLATALQERGLCNRNGTFFYKDHLCKSKVPMLALAGDQDYICPPEAVYETVKHIPENLITYKVFGDSGSPHYSHYDIMGGHSATDQVQPYIAGYLNRHDIS